MGHFSRVFYCIHILEKVEISSKAPRIRDKIPNYDKEELIFQKLESAKYYLKIMEIQNKSKYILIVWLYH